MDARDFGKWSLQQKNPAVMAGWQSECLGQFTS
jgi:hypothetical protein